SKIIRFDASPDDDLVLTFDSTVSRLSGLRDWHGHNGAGYENAAALCEALKNGSYKGEWVIPPLELLCGRDQFGRNIQPDSLFAYQDKEDLKDTFCRSSNSCMGNPTRYWSCTE